MPKLGETVTEGTIGSWLKNEGDTVAFDDPLFEVSTDKVDSEIPSPYDGVLLEILVGAGETAPVGAVLARIGEPGAAGGSAPAAATAPAATAPATGTAPASSGSAEADRPQRPGAVPAGPAAHRGGRAGRLRDPGHRCRRPDPARGRRGGHRRRHRAGRRAGRGGARHRGTDPGGSDAGGRGSGARGGSDPGHSRARGGLGSDRPARRGRAAVPDAAGRGRRDEEVADRHRVRVDLGRGGLRQRGAGPRQAQGPVQEGGGGVAELPALHLPRRGRRPARLPHRQLLDRHRGQDDDHAPVRQPGRRGRPGPAGPGRARCSGTPTG